MAEKEVRSTTTKKTVRKAAPKKAASKTVPASKAAPKKTVVKKTSVRKAPTPVAAQRADAKTSNQIRIAGIVVFLLIITASVVVGVTGDGQISIENTFTERKAEATPEQRSVIESIPVQKTPVVDGGLVASGVPVLVPSKEPVATSTDDIASSTDAVASSTDAVSEDSDIQEEEVVEEPATEETTEPEEAAPPEEVAL